MLNGPMISLPKNSTNTNKTKIDAYIGNANAFQNFQSIVNTETKAMIDKTTQVDCAPSGVLMSKKA